MKKVTLIVLALCLLMPSICYAQEEEEEYIEVIGKVAGIRTGPSTSFALVAEARKGDVFELRGQEGEWYKILMFSGEWRYIYKPLAKKATYTLLLPTSVSTRRSIFTALSSAEERSQAEADQKYPMADRYGRPISGNMESNIYHMRILDDRYKLEVFHQFDVQPPIYLKLIVEGVEKGWWR